MTGRKAIRTKRLPAVALHVMLLVAALLGTGCRLDLCRIFNCDTLFFMEDLSQALQNLGSIVGNGQDAMDMDGDSGNMDMGGDHEDTNHVHDDG